MKRGEKRPKKVFALYPIQTEPEMTERRFPAKVPQENMRHRILVQCNKLEYVLISFYCSFSKFDLVTILSYKRASPGLNRFRDREIMVLLSVNVQIFLI